jgi:hypothetical protein
MPFTHWRCNNLVCPEGANRGIDGTRFVVRAPGRGVFRTRDSIISPRARTAHKTNTRTTARSAPSPVPRAAAPCSLRMRRSARASRPAARSDEMPSALALLGLAALAALNAPAVPPAASSAAIAIVSAPAPAAKRARHVRAALLAARVPLSHALQRPALLRRSPHSSGTRPHPRPRPPRRLPHPPPPPRP